MSLPGRRAVRSESRRAAGTSFLCSAQPSPWGWHTWTVTFAWHTVVIRDCARPAGPRPGVSSHSPPSPVGFLALTVLILMRHRPEVGSLFTCPGVHGGMEVNAQQEWGRWRDAEVTGGDAIAAPCVTLLGDTPTPSLRAFPRQTAFFLHRYDCDSTVSGGMTRRIPVQMHTSGSNIVSCVNYMSAACITVHVTQEERERAHPGKAAVFAH